MALREVFASFGVAVDDSGLKKLEGGIDTVAKKLNSFGLKLGAVLGATAIGAFVNSQIEFGSAINDTAERLGVGTEELQKFQYAAKLNGVSAEEAAGSLKFLNKAIGEASASAGSEQAKKFAALGVSLKDASGKARPMLDVLGDLADHFAATDDPAAKTALAMQLFGRAGSALIPTLNLGGDGLRKMFREADALGGVMGDKLVKASDAAGDQMDRLKFAGQGLANRIMSQILPSIIQWTTTLTDWVASAGEVLEHSTAIQSALITLAILGGIAAVVWGVLNVEILAVVLALALLYLAVDEVYGLFTGADSAIGRFIDSLFGAGTAAREVDKVKSSIDEVFASVDAAWTIIKALKPAFDAVEQAAGPLVGLFKAIFGPSPLILFVNNLNAIVLSVRLFVSMLQTALKTLGTTIKDVAGNKVFAAVLDKAFGDGSAEGLSQFGTDLVQATTAKATLPGGAGKFGDKKASLIDLKNNTTITINGATDPQAVRDAVYTGMTDSQQDAQDALYGDAYGEDVQ